MALVDETPRGKRGRKAKALRPRFVFMTAASATPDAKLEKVRKEIKRNHGGFRPGAGRRKGVPNKINGDLKSMILGALEQKGGVEYLVQQADMNPTAFLSLVGKVLPMTVAGDKDNPVSITIAWGKSE